MGGCEKAMPRRIKMPPLEEISRHYKDAAGRAAARYKDAAKYVEWREAAIRGHTRWVEEITKSEVQERHLKGVEKRDDAFFRKMMELKGAKVLRDRIILAVPQHKEGYSPIHSALDGLEIPDKGPDPYENVDNILKLVIKKMRVAAGKETE